MGKTFPQLQEHQARIRRADGNAKNETIAQGKALLSDNCEKYIDAQGFDAIKLLRIIAAKHQTGGSVALTGLG